jgi:hypothetical protein
MIITTLQFVSTENIYTHSEMQTIFAGSCQHVYGMLLLVYGIANDEPHGSYMA